MARKKDCATAVDYGFIPATGCRGARILLRERVGCGTLACDMPRKRLRVIYSGHVQGVGFRYTVKSLASGFEVTGRVSNLTDGRVELVGEGAEDELSAFRQAIRDSGLEHFIRNEDATWTDATNEFRGFEIGR
jgi:acylphosphatase